MTKTRTANLLVVLAVALPAQAAPAESSDALLRLLSQDAKVARSMPLGTYPRVVRDLAPLVGVSQAAIFNVMGAPDSCPWPSLAQCEKVPSWIYSFWPIQKDTSHGAGWSLILDVKDNRVWRAYWIAQ
jgi:hypothetical protein